MSDDISSWTNDIHQGDAKETLAEMPESSVHMCMTSPPYYGLRDYSAEGQIGLEDTLDEYIQKLVDVGRELRRVLRDDGSWWLNLGDSYAGSGQNNDEKTSGEVDGDGHGRGHIPSTSFVQKDKMLVPHRVAIALQEDGWVVRNDVTWLKPNPMPSSVKDRLNTTTEQVFHLTPNPDYWYDLDAIREAHKPDSARLSKTGDHKYSNDGPGDHTMEPEKRVHPAGKNPGDVFEVTTKPYPDAHFACVSDDTEILTKEGWKTYDELQRGEKVATYDTDADRVELESLSSIHTYDVDTELLHVGNRDLDILMTEDHRNVTQHNRTGEVRVRRGYDLTGRDNILVHAPSDWETNAGVGEPLAELVGWIIAEAHYRESGGIRIYQQEGDDADRIRDLLNQLDVPHTERTRRETDVIWSIPVCPWADTIRSLAPEKQLTEFLASMPEDDLQALFDGLVRGDGYVREDDGRVGFTEKNSVTRDWFQVIAFRLGYHAIDGTKDIHCTDRRAIGIRGTNGEGLNVESINYDGVVWCPKTPNGTWVARRNGRPFITGNTFPPELCEKPIKATCPPKVCADCGAPYERKRLESDVPEPNTSRKQGRRALEKYRHSFLTADHLRALRAVGFTDAGQAQEVYDGFGNNTEEVEKLAEEAKDVLGGYAREFLGDNVVDTEWVKPCDCDTDETEAGIALDPFAGAGTTCMVAKRERRRFVGIDLNGEYCEMAREREMEEQAGKICDGQRQATLGDMAATDGGGRSE